MTILHYPLRHEQYIRVERYPNPPNLCLHLMDADGTRLKPITVNPGHKLPRRMFTVEDTLSNREVLLQLEITRVVEPFAHTEVWGKRVMLCRWLMEIPE